MKKSRYILIICCAVCCALIIAFIVNVLFKIKTDGLFCAEWSAGDALNYVGSMVGAISTFALSLVAYKQNEKLQKLEDNNYIASNSCMVLIDKIQIKPQAYIPVNYELHCEQILKEKNNEDEVSSGYKIEINLNKIDASIQATPSLIYASRCTLFVGDNKEKTLENAIWTENVREGFTRVAILESGIAFNCEILLAKSKQEKFERDIQAEKNSLTIEIELHIITDKYVMTKCKCRACCDYQNNSGTITWNSKNPMVFFYGHEIKNRKEIQVLGEE